MTHHGSLPTYTDIPITHLIHARGRRAWQYRRTSGELWDSIVMGRPL
jgi:hypothetical protein